MNRHVVSAGGLFLLVLLSGCSYSVGPVTYKSTDKESGAKYKSTGDALRMGGPIPISKNIFVGPLIVFSLSDGLPVSGDVAPGTEADYAFGGVEFNFLPLRPLVLGTHIALYDQVLKAGDQFTRTSAWGMGASVKLELYEFLFLTAQYDSTSALDFLNVNSADTVDWTSSGIFIGVSIIFAFHDQMND